MPELTATIVLVRSSEFSLEVELHCPVGITCIMGPSGSGKSTLLSVISGLHPHNEGTLKVDGVEQHFSSPVSRSPTASPPSTRTWRWSV